MIDNNGTLHDHTGRFAGHLLGEADTTQVLGSLTNHTEFVDDDGDAWISGLADDPRGASAVAHKLALSIAAAGRHAMVMAYTEDAYSEFEMHPFDSAEDAIDWASRFGAEIDADDRGLSEDGSEFRLYRPC